MGIATLERNGVKSCVFIAAVWAWACVALGNGTEGTNATDRATVIIADQMVMLGRPGGRSEGGEGGGYQRSEPAMNSRSSGGQYGGGPSAGGSGGGSPGGYGAPSALPPQAEDDLPF